MLNLTSTSKVSFISSEMTLKLWSQTEKQTVEWIHYYALTSNMFDEKKKKLLNACF